MEFSFVCSRCSFPQRVADADFVERRSVYFNRAPLNRAAYFWDFLPFPAPVVEVSSVFADIVRVRPPM
jgi:hypothetical protein